ncbi:hypothetical protein AAG906_005167 [Vitis piasezkii]
MTTLHGSTPSLRRRVEGCVSLEGMIAFARDILKFSLVSSESAPRSVRVWCGFVILGQSRGDISSLFREIKHGSWLSHWLVHNRHGFYSTWIDGLSQLISSRPPWLLFRRPWLRIRQLRVSDSSSTWDDLDGIPVASLPAKFRMPDIERSNESISSFISAGGEDSVDC